jgi:gluconolactonase
MNPRIAVIVFCLFASLIGKPSAAQQPGGDPCTVPGTEPSGRGGARGGGGGVAAPQQQRFPRDVTVTEIPGVLAAGAKWVEVWRGWDNADGIIAAPDGGVLFAQEQPNIVRKLDIRGMDSAFVKDTHGAGAVAMDYQGRLLGVQRTGTDPGFAHNPANPPCTEPTKLAILWPEKDRRVLADNINGKSLGRLNDLVVSKNGTVYFNGSGTFYIKPGGKAACVDTVNINSNGIILSPDEKTLYITTGGGITAFDIKADGTPANRRNFATFEGGGGGDGSAVDSEGRLYVSGVNNGGIQVISPQGKVLGTIPTPRNVISITFAGPDKKTLYAVGGGMQYFDGLEYDLAPGFRNDGKTIYKIQMIAQGYKGRAK